MKRVLSAVLASVTILTHAAQPSPVQTAPDHILLTHSGREGKYVFDDALDAISYINSSGLSSVTLMIEPSVYWLDDPDDDAVRRNPENSQAVPFAAVIRCDTLRIEGLGLSPQDVVLAVNRGQTQGALGNYTMLNFKGRSLETRNVTFGNYCNVDLVYPADRTLDRPRRRDAIVQAQIGICDGTDRLFAENCRFISRLNLCPLTGARRSLYKDCYFECTDDALTGSAVYLGCTFTFYSGKPFYSTPSTGAVFLDCDIHTTVEGIQYLTKMPGQVTMIDTRWTSDKPVTLQWTRDNSAKHCYQSNVTLNGTPVTIDAYNPDRSTDITNTPLLRAYKTDSLYNIPNLLGGSDGWDPLGMAESIDNTDKGLPVYLHLIASEKHPEAQGDTVKIGIFPRLWGDYPADTRFNRVAWTAPTTLQLLKGGSEALALSANIFPTEMDAKITASTETGLKGCTTVKVAPFLLPAPWFDREPRLSKGKGVINLVYTLDNDNGDDESEIIWYRDGRAVRHGKGLSGCSYTLTRADEGNIITATIAPQLSTTERGHVFTTERGIKVDGDMLRGIPRQEKELTTSFEEIVIAPGTPGLKGEWHFDTYKPIDTAQHDWQPDGSAGWFYGKGTDAATGNGLIQSVKGARLSYTPVRENCRSMKISLIAEPAKGPGQGFGSATGQYLDICVAYDPVSLTGYSLRIERVPDYDKAVTFTLMHHHEGIAAPVSEAMPSDCFRTPCHIEVSLDGERLTASARTDARLRSSDNPAVQPSVYLSSIVEPSAHTSLLIQHTGSTGSSATLLRDLKINWD